MQQLPDTWSKATLTTTSAGIEIVSAFLIEQGVGGVEIQDAQDFNDFLSGTEIHWDYVDESLMKLKKEPTTVTFYLPDNAQGADTLLAILPSAPASIWAPSPSPAAPSARRIGPLSGSSITTPPPLGTNCWSSPPGNGTAPC